MAPTTRTRRQATSEIEGVVFGDGIKDDRLEVGWGQQVEISAARERLACLGGALPLARHARCDLVNRWLTKSAFAWHAGLWARPPAPGRTRHGRAAAKLLAGRRRSTG